MNTQPRALWLVAGAVGVLLAAPTLILIPMSFSESSSLSFPPSGFTLKWYANFFASSRWMDAAAHSVTIGVVTTILSVVLGIPLAMVLVRSRFRGLGALNALIIGPAVVPAVIVAIGTYGLMTTLGLTRTLTGLVIAHTVMALPLVVITVTASAQTLNRTLELAAASLGANRWNTFRFAVLPPLLPGIGIGAIYGFVTSWDEMIVSLFITGAGYSTLPVHMWNQVRSTSDPTTAAVSTLLVGISTLILFAAFLSSTASNKRKKLQA
ncbi:ABC transporter permease [Paenarthrobacter aromaticivorans]|uniref:ABC transporter permease n=1 Tax=Paenarthrobacter aromaticivorans TaxID=2849150 RepID=UPI003A8041A2